MIFTPDFVTRENYWQIASPVTQKKLFTVTHALCFISCELLLLSETIYRIIYLTLKIFKKIYTVIYNYMSKSIADMN